MELEFNITGELGGFDQELNNGIHNGEYLDFYIDTNIKNIESLEYLTIEVHNNSGIMSKFSKNMTREELEMADFTIKIDLPTESNTLQKIRFIPHFREDNEYSIDNTQGISRMQTIQWATEQVIVLEDGQEYMPITLDHELKTELNGFELAYVYNDKLQYLTFPEGFALSYNYDEITESYRFLIPTVYNNPDTHELVKFKEEQLLLIRYNSPVKRGIAIGIGKMYFEHKGYNYDAHLDIPKAELLLVNADSEKAYSEFTSDYYYQTPIRNITPYLV